MPLGLLFQLSLRNIRLHRRRNLMLLCAIAIAVFTVMMANTFLRGMQYDIREQAISNLNGDIRVHAPGYLDDPSITRGFELAAGFAPDNVEGWAARVRIPAVIMSEREVRGVQFVGVDPEREHISFLGTATYQGEALASSEERRIVIGRELALQLDTGVGRRLVIITQGADGLNREAGFRIAGIYDVDGTALEQMFVFTGVAALQRLVDTNVVTEVSIRLTPAGRQFEMLDRFKAFFSDLDVNTWQQLEPMAAAFFVFADAGVFIYFFIIMTALVFGLVNALVTSVMERVRELGMLRAVGMRPSAVVTQVVMESTIIMLMGVAMGLAAGTLVYGALPSVIDLSAFGDAMETYQMPTKVRLRLFISDMALITGLSVVLALVASFFPARRAVRISPLEALKR